MELITFIVIMQLVGNYIFKLQLVMHTEKYLTSTMQNLFPGNRLSASLRNNATNSFLQIRKTSSV